MLPTFGKHSRLILIVYPYPVMCQLQVTAEESLR